MNFRIKKLVKQYVEILILDELRKHELHGYGFIELIKKRYGFEPSPSMIYPVLKELMKKGFVEAKERYSDSKRYVVYRITEKGLDFLRENSDLLEEAKRHEEKIRLAINIGFFDLLKDLRLLFEQLDRLDNNKLSRVRHAINTFLTEIEDLVREDDRG
ncbi:MAG: PadR family transcriptional regulator [Staphylothermus sp.]|nr:PadR family transcriptional regulator [Staphylothermus sp.]